ncbi:MAG: hypothetical protein KBD17_01530 [Candidatus Pacebacteria bacterium]|nr:hypothetical protein [Candidatus Paceibacterota bacterium]
MQNEPKEVGVIGHIINIAEVFATYISSAFFVALLVMAIFVPQYVMDRNVMFYASGGVFILESLRNKVFKGHKFQDWIKIGGSVSFFMFFVSDFFFKESFLSVVFNTYKEIFGIIISRGFITFILYFVFIFILIKAVFGIFNALVTLTEKLTHGRVERILLDMLLFIFLITLLAMLIFFRLDIGIESRDKLFQLFFQSSGPLMPVLGVSLVYLHSKALLSVIRNKTEQKVL